MVVQDFFFLSYCRKIFSEKKHPEGLKTFGFIWDMFRTGEPNSMHKALLWLQVRVHYDMCTFPCSPRPPRNETCIQATSKYIIPPENSMCAL